MDAMDSSVTVRMDRKVTPLSGCEADDTDEWLQ